MTTAGEGLRLTELLASLSLATDLAIGQPAGHGLRTSLLAVAIARQMGLENDQIRAVHQVALLRFLGCTADAAETAALAGGDDARFNATFAPVLNGSRLDGVKTLTRAAGVGEPVWRRGRMVLAALADTDEPARGLAAHCEVATMLARRLGLGPDVTAALGAAYERWDGHGYPAGLDGEAIPLEIRIGMVARDIDIFITGRQDVDGMLDQRQGRAYDPAVVDAYRRLNAPHPGASWEAVLDAEPRPAEYVGDLDATLEVMADFSDLKSPWTRGHSRAVSRLGETAARTLGLDSEQAELMRRVGLVHDLGRVAVPNGVWDKEAGLSTAEWEQVRLHPYMTERILRRCPRLDQVSQLASGHHERLDGSGYHRGAVADQLTTAARILAAADVMAALLAPRPYREPLDMDGACEVMRQGVTAGTLDGDAVEAVIAAAGGEAAAPRATNPGGLTDREIEVLELMCRGHTNRQIGDELFISPKTVGRHIENIYTKISVSSRAAAAVYAMEHHLLA